MNNIKKIIDNMNILERAEIIKLIAYEIKQKSQDEKTSISNYQSYVLASNELKQMQSGEIKEWKY